MTGVNDLTYDGSEQALVTGSATGGELVYSLTQDGEYTESVPTGKNAGDYTVYYKVKGDANHFDSEPQSVTVTVRKAVSSASVTGNDLTYDGSEHTLVTGSATGGELVYSLTQDGEYTSSAPTGKNAGNYTVYYKVIGDANHLDSTGSVTVTVSKATPEYTKPEFEAIDKDTDVYSIELPEGWTWKENSMRVNEDGDTVVTAIYNPDADNYESVEIDMVITYKKLSGGAIAGIAIGSTLGAVLIAYGVCALLFKKKILC